MAMELTRRPPRLQRSDAGFSLIEVLVAAAILLVVAVGILPLFASSIRSNQEGNDSTQVSNFARERVEEFFELPFNSTRLTLVNGTTAVYDEYYSKADHLWKDGAAPSEDPGLWTRTTTVRQYSTGALEDGRLDAAEALDAGAPISQVHFKEIEVSVDSTREAGMLGPGKRLTIRTLKAQ